MAQVHVCYYANVTYFPTCLCCDMVLFFILSIKKSSKWTLFCCKTLFHKATRALHSLTDFHLGSAEYNHSLVEMVTELFHRSGWRVKCLTRKHLDSSCWCRAACSLLAKAFMLTHRAHVNLLWNVINQPGWVFPHCAWNLQLTAMKTAVP